MKEIIEEVLDGLKNSGNLRSLPMPDEKEPVDLSSNDYLGLASDRGVRQRFAASFDPADEAWALSASASRLLQRTQQAATDLENDLDRAYGHNRRSLIFNSGYHANTGIVSALGTLPKVGFVADKLVHASIIDGMKLSGAPFRRFRHNDLSHLETTLRHVVAEGLRPVVVVEGIYSMDGDHCNVGALVSLKRDFPEMLLYIDEAHSFGVEGPGGLGVTARDGALEDVDIVMGTFGKALASCGAFALTNDSMRSFLINRARSFIFSTALPPAILQWTRITLNEALHSDWRRDKLRKLGDTLHKILEPYGTLARNHIQPLITGDPRAAVKLSQKLREEGFAVLPIRTPTVPPGTDRLRFSLSADLSPEALQPLANTLYRNKDLIKNG